MDRSGFGQHLDKVALAISAPAAGFATRLRVERHRAKLAGYERDGHFDLVGQDVERHADRVRDKADARPAFLGGRLERRLDRIGRGTPLIERLHRHVARGFCTSSHGSSPVCQGVEHEPDRYV
jgi:hypothetical protein